MLLNSWPPQDKRFLSHFRSAFTPVDAFSSSSLSAQPGRHLIDPFWVWHAHCFDQCREEKHVADLCHSLESTLVGRGQQADRSPSTKQPEGLTHAKHRCIRRG